MTAFLTSLVCSALTTCALLVAGSAHAADLGQNIKQYIVQYKTGAADEVSRTLRRSGAQEIRRLSRHRAVVVRMSKASMRRLANNRAIEQIEIDPRRDRLAQTVPAGLPLIQAEQLSPFGTPRKVCIIDSGYAAEHPDLPDSSRVTGMALPGTGAWNAPGDSHGTHVAGTIAAIDNNRGVIGAHPGVGLSLHIVKIFSDDGLWAFGSELIAALESCTDAGADVISMSLGGPLSSSAERSAFANAYRNGALSIAAAGNDGNSTCSYPACYDSVISVGAIDRHQQVAGFSQRNAQIELTAPGVGVLSTVKGGGIAAWSGTSVATPHVAGAAALLWSLHAQCKNTSIRQALTASAADRGSPGRDPSYGYGIVQLLAADQLLLTNGCEVGWTPTWTEGRAPPIVNSYGCGHDTQLACPIISNTQTH